jgi:Arc/MetJ-type ribon-helix-helix transcriptional regulator
MGKVQELRPRPEYSEKITINLGFVDLGHVDLMVRDGFYANRTDFIRTAIRNQLDRLDATRSTKAGRLMEATTTLQRNAGIPPASMTDFDTNTSS